MSDYVVALTGGVGGAKLAYGLTQVFEKERVKFVVNTGDDFVYNGLYICPDIDTLMYTLSGSNDQDKGWGLQDETWTLHNQLEKLGVTSWFQIGDKDAATHIARTTQLSEGKCLTSITRELCDAFGVENEIYPLSDLTISTKVVTKEFGELSFQDYFVKNKCEPSVEEIRFEGDGLEFPNPQFLSLLESDNLKGVIVCPSNPYLSLEAFFLCKDVKKMLSELSVPVVVISPIIQGDSIKGPTKKIMSELGLDTSVLSIAEHYKEMATCIFIDNKDLNLKSEIEKFGIDVSVSNIYMDDAAKKVALANEVKNYIFNYNKSE
ncbi:2-phospho-L-lactate transferase [Pseudoalteromonas sp. OOF1S-7]|uniref:2-phospho-L-lactate transferase n=1 Tax=Pseudoalteromonas sp. OOF1S-7 TaxID=2917757 RepID=UPI001EF3FFAD|nr:2-phospho-L-lactate transferase [Pseudoalteromonas sp. OOF1S-7]